jgi:hypothetical protein
MSRHRADLAIIERQQNTKAAEDSRKRQEREAVTAGRLETISLRLVRGDVIEQPKQGRGEREKPARVFDGWDLARATFTKEGKRSLVMAGDKYADTYRTAWSSGMSCGYEPAIKGAPTDHEAQDVIARRELSKINRDALCGLKSFIGTLEAVCGRGETLLALAGAKHAIPVAKERLTGALSLLAVHYRME